MVSVQEVREQASQQEHGVQEEAHRDGGAARGGGGAQPHRGDPQGNVLESLICFGMFSDVLCHLGHFGLKFNPTNVFHA